MIVYFSLGIILEIECGYIVIINRTNYAFFRFSYMQHWSFVSYFADDCFCLVI